MAEPSDSGRSGRWRVGVAVAGLLVLHFALAMASVAGKSLTHDEILHVTAGTAYWRYDDYRLQPENGNFPQRWASLPIALSEQFVFPTLDQGAWQGSNVGVLGDQFCHQLDNDLDAMLRRGRAMIALLSVALCWLVFVWARQLFGTAGGLLSLGLCALSPTVLAHGSLMTSGTSSALFLALTMWCGWRTLERVTVGRVLASSLAAAGLLLSKMSGPLVLPMALLLVVVALISRRPMELRLRGRPVVVAGLGSRVWVLAGLLVVHAVIAWSVVWGAYGFRYSAFADPSQPAQFNFYGGSLESVAERAGAAGGVLRWCGEHEVLPEAYLYGTGVVLAAQSRLAFLNGQYSQTGWTSFFPYCLLVKTPLPLFGLLLAAAAAWWHGRRRRESLSSSAPLWILLAVYWAAALSTPLNIGHRHLLPTYAPMFVLAGGAAYWLTTRRRVAVWGVGLLLALFAVESGRAFPHYLAYFNPITGRDDAYRHLIDSSLDWGQDLPGLAAWLADRDGKERPICLAYFGTGSPEHYGIEAEWIPVTSWLPRDAAPRLMGELHGGLYCVSATALQSVYTSPPGKWNPDYEQAYRALVEWKARFDRGPGRQAGAAARQYRTLAQLDRARAARLMAYLRQREPTARVGYSILIYDLTDDDVREALEGPPPEQFSDYTGAR